MRSGLVVAEVGLAVFSHREATGGEGVVDHLVNEAVEGPYVDGADISLDPAGAAGPGVRLTRLDRAVGSCQRPYSDGRRTSAQKRHHQQHCFDDSESECGLLVHHWFSSRVKASGCEEPDSRASSSQLSDSSSDQGPRQRMAGS